MKFEPVERAREVGRNLPHERLAFIVLTLRSQVPKQYNQGFNSYGAGAMGRIGSFVLGMACGAGLLWGAMHYHVVRTTEGVYLVPKISQNLSDPYVDVRTFSLADWQQHRSLAAAIMKNNQSHLMGDSSMNSFKTRIMSAVDELLGAGETAP